MNNKQESIMSGLAAMLVLFTAMLNPLVSVSLAVVLLIGFSLYKYTRPGKRK